MLLKGPVFPNSVRHGWPDRKHEGRPEGWSLESQGSVHVGVTATKPTLHGMTPEVGHGARQLPGPALHHSLALHSPDGTGCLFGVLQL